MITAEELEKLAEFKEKGILSEEEFNSLKEEYLKSSDKHTLNINFSKLNSKKFKIIGLCSLFVFSFLALYKSSDKNIAATNDTVASTNISANENYWNMSSTRQYFYCTGYLIAHYEITANSRVAQSMAAQYRAKITKLSTKKEMDTYFPAYFKRGYADRGYLDDYNRNKIFAHCTQKFNGYAGY